MKTLTELFDRLDAGETVIIEKFGRKFVFVPKPEPDEDGRRAVDVYVGTEGTADNSDAG